MSLDWNHYLCEFQGIELSRISSQIRKILRQARDMTDMPTKSSTSTPLYLLGLPHFVAQRDLYNPAPLFSDITTKQRQIELEEAARNIAGLEFDTICVESTNQDKINREYKDYLQSKEPQSSQEIHQLVFRVAAKKDIKQIHACDFELPMGEFDLPSEVDFASWQESFDKGLSESYQVSFWETLKFLNKGEDLMTKPYRELLMYGDSSVESAMNNWYKRNLMILKNLLRVPSHGSKALFLGASHIPVIAGLARSLGIESRSIVDMLS